MKAFARLHPESEEAASARLEVPVSELAYYDETAGRVVEPGRHTLCASPHPETLAASIVVG